MQLMDARKETFDHIELFDAPAMFTNLRIDRSTVPEGLFCYDVRGSDNDPGALNAIEPFVFVNICLKKGRQNILPRISIFSAKKSRSTNFVQNTALKSANRKRVCWTV